MTKKKPRSRSLGNPTAAGQGCIMVFGFLFAAFPVVMAMFSYFSTRSLADASRSWVPTPCEVEFSGSRRAYQIHWVWEGEKFWGHRLQHAYVNPDDPLELPEDMFSDGELIDPHCYVDPEDPAQAVLVQGIRPMRGSTWFFFVVLLIFFSVGVGIMFGGWRSIQKNRALEQGELPERKRRSRPSRRAPPSSPPIPTDSGRGFRLAPDQTPAKKLLILAGVAAFWNGIVGTFLVVILKGQANGDGPPKFVLLFLIPFVVIGVLLIVGVFHSLLALLNPKPTLTLDRAAIPIGGSARLEWNIAGHVRRLMSLELRWVGEEVARYRRGTSVSESIEIFEDRVLVHLEPSSRLAEGHVDIAVPADAMHSFEAKHNRVRWKIALVGPIRRWPDLELDYPIEVLPSEDDPESTRANAGGHH